MSLRHIVLLGAGHTHLEIIRLWGESTSLASTATLTCISNFDRSTYSGMLPGALAGQYEQSQMEIDLNKLCASRGVRLIVDNAIGMEHQHGVRKLLFKERLAVEFDVLSVGIGSQPVAIGKAATTALFIKPMQTFLARLGKAFGELIEKQINRPWKVAVVGGGAGGTEIACCLPAYLREHFPKQAFKLHLIDRNKHLLPDLPRRARRLLEKELAKRGAELVLGKQVTDVSEDKTLFFMDNTSLQADLIVWATGATGPPLLSGLDLPTDRRGFLLTKNTLQSTGDDAIFAVGDSGSLATRDVPKAGVYAVRQAPILWENLQRQLADGELKPFQPQGSFLKLINQGNGKAVLVYRGFSFSGKWCWKLKDWIDRNFMRKYQE